MESEFIKSLSLDDEFSRHPSVNDIDTAVHDLLSNNYFSVVENASGPYEVLLSLADKRLILNIKSSMKSNAKVNLKDAKIMIPLSSFRSIIKDYFIICESYHEMLKTGHNEKVEAVDAGRRSMHNEGAEIMLKLLENRINMDFETARRLFTIITILHM